MRRARASASSATPSSNRRCERHSWPTGATVIQVALDRAWLSDRSAAGLTRPTFHLVPAAIWDAADTATAYEDASLAREGFIHCTDGVDALGATFDRYFLADPRPFVALTVDLDALDVPWRYDVPGSPYPHIYGPIRRGAISAVRVVVRAPDGHFERLADE